MEQSKELTITRQDILDLTHYGIGVYAHILHQYYPEDETVLILKGKKCKPAKNPFNGNALTLEVCIKNNMAMHSDPALKNFQGNVFAFAAQHYHLKGAALLQKIYEDMKLGYAEHGQPEGAEQHELHVQPGQHGQKSQYGKNGNQAPQFSYFQKPVRNTVPFGIRSLADVYLLIKGTTYQKVTAQLRVITDQVQARKFKEQNFDYATFSGVFSSRKNEAIVRHSGLFVVDFDHVEDVAGLKQQLLEDDHFETELLFVSPSGKGLKWIIAIDLKKATHQQWALSIGAYLFKIYGLKMDPSGKDVARACFLPHDPNVYIHPKYKV